MYFPNHFNLIASQFEFKDYSAHEVGLNYLILVNLAKYYSSLPKTNAIVVVSLPMEFGIHRVVFLPNLNGFAITTRNPRILVSNEIPGMK